MAYSVWKEELNENLVKEKVPGISKVQSKTLN